MVEPNASDNTASARSPKVNHQKSESNGDGSGTRTPPRIPNLPAGNPRSSLSPNVKGGKASSGRKSSFDFKAAVSKAMEEEYDGANTPPNSSGVSPPFKPRHERGVSWDQSIPENVFNPTSPGQPPRHDGSSDAPPSLMARTTLPPRPTTVNRGASSGSSGSYPPMMNEKEAEDSVLKSLEDRDPMTHKNSIGKDILAGVPDTIEHSFRSETDKNNARNKTPQSPGRAGATGAGAGGARPRLMSKDPSVMTRKVVPDLPPSHRRQLTVEEALFGLTAALNQVQNDDVKAGIRNDIPRHERADTADSQDRLAKTAELMFGKRFMRNRKSSSNQSVVQDDDAVGTEGRTENPRPTPAAANPVSAKSKWNLVKANLDVHKKYDLSDDDSDDNDLAGIDIETGDQNGDNNGPSPMSATDGDDRRDNGNSGDLPTKSKKGRGKKIRGAMASPFRHLPYSDRIKKEWDVFNNFLSPRKTSMLTWARYILIYLWLPALAAAAILYHFFENPPTGKGPWDVNDPNFNATDVVESKPVDRLENEASASWWIIFVCIRQTSLVVISKCVEAVIVDFLAIQTRAILRAFGPVITLLLVQSKGWPFLLSSWGILNFILVTGDNAFNNHWLFWQDIWGLFNDYNPSGDVTNTLWLRRICAVASALGVTVSAKRVVVGIYLGRQTFANYSDQLAQVMNKMLQVSQVSILALSVERRYWDDMEKMDDGRDDRGQSNDHTYSNDNLLSLIQSANEDRAITEDVSMMDMTVTSENRGEDLGKVIDVNDKDPFTGGLSEAQKIRLADLLGRWEEPGRGLSKNDYISVGSVLQFRRALASMDTPYPFSGSFGLADTRERCVASAQNVYDRLLLKNQTVNGKLHFDTLAVLALTPRGELDPEKARELIRTFRPDRDGGVSCLDFVRSIDSVYKELRMLRATVAASSKIDKALESIMNMVFYIAVFCIILATYGFDPLSLFLSLSSIILAFAFMIGSASAKYFEGLLLILVQRPYGIGDRINISNPESDTNGGGAQGWIVDDVTLFTTTIYMVGTNERATVSNGTLAKSRIINGRRSLQAVVVLTVKFGLESPFDRIDIFKSAVEKFVKSRPREWLSLLGLRAGRVEADLGFVEYVVVLQHRESWQNAGDILESKHLIHSFMLELVKKLNLRYKQPALPIMLDRRFHETIGQRPNAVGQELQESAPLSPRSNNTAYTDDIAACFTMFEGR